MERDIKHFIEHVLRDYPKLDSYIKKREEELRIPYKPVDENVGGGRAQNKRSEPELNMLITIDEDRCLRNLRRNKKAVDDALDDSSTDTITIITELYFKKRQEYTIDGLVANGKIYVSRAQAFILRDKFLKKVAQNLEIPDVNINIK